MEAGTITVVQPPELWAKVHLSTAAAGTAQPAVVELHPAADYATEQGATDLEIRFLANSGSPSLALIRTTSAWSATRSHRRLPLLAHQAARPTRFKR